MIYTISADLISNLSSHESYYAEILFPFANEKNRFKIAKDIDCEIFNIYKRVTKHPEIVKIWIDLMSYSKCALENIPVSIKNERTDEEKLFKLCSSVHGCHKMVVYSVQNSKYPVDSNNYIKYEGVKIRLLDRDEMSSILNANIIINGNVENSIVAGRDIIDSTNVHY